MNKYNRYWKHPIIEIMLALLLWKCIDFCVAIFLSIILSLSVVTTPGRWSAAAEATSSEFVGAVCAVVTLITLQRLTGTVSLGRVGLTRRGTVTETGLGVLIGTASYLLLMFCLAWAKVFAVDRVDHGFPLVAALLFSLSIGFGEEVVFRGFIFQQIEARYGTALALLASSLVVGAYHIGGTTYGTHYLRAMIVGLSGGLLYSSAYLVNRRLWLPIGAHWAWNFCAVVFWGWGWGAKNPTFTPWLLDLHIDLSKPPPYPLLTGGNMGLVASPVSLATDVLVSALFLGIAVRRGHWKSRRPEPLGAS